MSGADPMSRKRKQCRLCPWRVDVDPHDIPDGYCETKHAGLRSTIAEPGEFRPQSAIRLMACHESKPGKEKTCVGWLANQLGPGNNIALRLAAMAGQVEGWHQIELVGEQHERFEDALPGGDR